MNLPSHVETIISLANLCRRHGGLDAAIEVYKTQLDSPQCEMATKAALVAEWARLLWKIKGAPDDARKVFQDNQQYYLDSRPFWTSYLMFEIEQPTSAEIESTQYERIKQVVSDVRSKSTLVPETVKELVQIYMAYLLERGTKDTAKEYMALDREVHGPASVAAARTGGTFAAPPTAPADAQPAVPPPGQQPTPDQAAASAQAYAAWQQHQSPVNGGPVA
jgi:pre-mRNA-processing factor 39